MHPVGVDTQMYAAGSSETFLKCHIKNIIRVFALKILFEDFQVRDSAACSWHLCYAATAFVGLYYPHPLISIKPIKQGEQVEYIFPPNCESLFVLFFIPLCTTRLLPFFRRLAGGTYLEIAVWSIGTLSA